MLRTLRSRRRPRYGAQICAVIAAVLLLLSVSVLHSRLGFDRRSQVHPFSSSSRLNFEFSQDSSDNTDDLVANRLLEDVDNDGAGIGDDDRIDELDVVEEKPDEQSRVSDEEVLAGEELEEESELEGGDGNRNRRSGYFWDHVVGAKRQAFDKRSIDQWEDYSSFHLYSNSDDPSKIAFGSDDQPVDEEVRQKLYEIKGIEDALLLKNSHGVSPLREGWATWFEAKSDFLRRDRMFKSNLELLNPLKNPLLQDPDGAGLTYLTRGDKLVQKGLLNDLRKMPFVVKKPLGIMEMPHESKLIRDGDKVGTEKMAGVKVGTKGSEREVEEKTAEVKRAERKTLNDSTRDGAHAKTTDNSSDSLNLTDNSDFANANSLRYSVNERIISSYNSSKIVKTQFNNSKGMENIVDSSKGKLDRQSISKNSHSEYRIKGQLSGHIHADGKRWGYFPGLFSHLSFSDFMDVFLKQGNCSMRVFMVWNSPTWMFSVRHQRGLESLLFHHPDACVVVFSEMIELDFFNDFVKDGLKVAVAMPNLDELLMGTPTHIFASVWFEWKKTKYYSIHYSELVRLAALYKYGGIYLDSDIIVLKPLSSLNNSVGIENELAGNSLSGAVMAFRKHSPFIMECLKEFHLTYDDSRLRWNGADLLTRVGKRFLREANNIDKQVELKIQPSFVFFPISPQNITRYFKTPADETNRSEQDNLLRKVLNESITFHFWNTITSALVPEPESLVMRLLNHRCLHCLDVL